MDTIGTTDSQRSAPGSGRPETGRGTTEQYIGGRRSVSSELESDTGQTPGDSISVTQTTDEDIQRPRGQVSAGHGSDAGGSEQGTVRTDV